jgi:hypothetical protein
MSNEQPRDNVVEIMQLAIQEFVIAENTCPPLTKLSRRYTRPDGKIDWQDMANAKAVVFERLTSPTNSDDSLLLKELSNKYFEIYKQISEGSAPLTSLIIFPSSFRGNDRFDLIDRTARRNLAEMLINDRKNSQGNNIIINILEKGSENSGQPKETFSQLITYWRSNDLDKKYIVLQQIIDDFLGTVYFYGSTIRDRDLEGMQSDRGPVVRQKILSEMPFYTLQIVNTAHPLIPDLMQRMDVRALRQENSRKSDEILRSNAKHNERKRRMKELRQMFKEF